MTVDFLINDWNYLYMIVIMHEINYITKCHMLQVLLLIIMNLIFIYQPYWFHMRSADFWFQFVFLEQD